MVLQEILIHYQVFEKLYLLLLLLQKLLHLLLLLQVILLNYPLNVYVAWKRPKPSFFHLLSSFSRFFKPELCYLA